MNNYLIKDGNRITESKAGFLIESHNYLFTDRFEIGKNKAINCQDIQLKIDEEGSIVVSGDAYLNYQKITGRFQLNIGDCLIIYPLLKIQYINKDILQIKVYDQKQVEINLLNIDKINNEYLNYPEYMNSPRIKKKYSEEKIKLEKPPEKDKDITISSLLKKLVPAIVGVVIAILMLWIRPRGIRGLLMFFSMVVSFSISMITLYQDRRTNKKHNINRKHVYEKYLLEKRKELTQLKTTELNARNYNNLRQVDILNEIDGNSSRLYERDYLDKDFLNIRLGVKTDVCGYGLENPFEKIQLRYEELELELKEVYEEFKEIKQVPVVVNICHNNIGFIGSRYIQDKQLPAIMNQIYFQQSYLDLVVIVITSKKNLENYKYLKWLKHLQNPYTNMNNIIVDEQSRDQLLPTYEQILRQRKQDYDQKKVYVPHLLFVIDNYTIIQNHPIMEYLGDDSKKYSFSLLYLASEENELPDNIDTVISYQNEHQAIVKLQSGKYENKQFELEEVEYDVDILEHYTRKIGELEHIKGIKSSIPDQLGFLEMYDVLSTEDLKIEQRWQKNKPYKSLRALIGKKSETDDIYLDLHEKFHGPHGLIAGTTGSGKSEIIQTYILSLALNFSPEQVGFLLIDYKGGGMANLFNGMPHHLGSITNLDGYQSLRALSSIKSELKRRQKIFSDFEVNHINDYHKLYENKKVDEALPHLFLISDEFAELKSEQPEFMKELVSAARIGRSLGIHLILATQKPTGVVDEQIWSNSKFKLALKVAEESDSKELLRTPDAAYIQKAGRGYLKVGTNELYELFQSGYSGAEYGGQENNKIDKRIYELDIFGRRKLINEQVIEQKHEKIEVQTELEAVLGEISKVYQQKEYKVVERPWLEPLADIIHFNEQFDIGDESFSVNVGVVDIPDRQKQIDYIINFEKTFNVLVSALQGMGKTTTIITILLQLAKKNNPNNIKYYIIDLGNGGLIALKSLNHTADYIRAHETDKINRFTKLLKEEIESRKLLFEKNIVSTIQAYNNKVEKKLKRIIIVIDNYEGMSEQSLKLNQLLISATREGGNLGIHFLISNNKAMSLKANIMVNVSEKIILYTNDKQDVSTSLGKTDYVQQEKIGRGHIKLDKPEIIQIYHPIKSDNFLVGLNETIDQINQKYQISNIGLPQMPKEITYKQRQIINNKVYIGYEYENISEKFIELDNTIIIGDVKRGKTNILKLILEQIKNQNTITIIDNFKKELSGYAHLENIEYIYKPNSLLNILTTKELSGDIVIINKIDLIEFFENKEQKIIYKELNNHLINNKKFILETSDNISTTHKFNQTMRKATNLIVMQNISQQRYFQVNNLELRKEQHQFSQAYIVEDGILDKVKFEKVVSHQADYILNEEELRQLSISNTEFLLEDQVYPIKDLILYGEHSEMFLKEIVTQLINKNYQIDFIDNENKELQIEGLNKIDDFANYQVNEPKRTILILNTLNIKGLNLKQKSEKFEELYPAKEEGLITIMLLDKKISATVPYLREMKKTDFGFISTNIIEQKVMKVKNQKIKESELKYDSNSYYVVNGKDIKKQQLKEKNGN